MTKTPRVGARTSSPSALLVGVDVAAPAVARAWKLLVNFFLFRLMLHVVGPSWTVFVARIFVVLCRGV